MDSYGNNESHKEFRCHQMAFGGFDEKKYIYLIMKIDNPSPYYYVLCTVHRTKLHYAKAICNMLLLNVYS